MLKFYKNKSEFNNKMNQIKFEEYEKFWKKNLKRRFVSLLFKLNIFRNFITKIIPYEIVIKFDDSNYYSDHRIAIYTSIFGDYDSIIEPLVHPDNCDYYIVTDNMIKENSAWNKVNIEKFKKDLIGLTDSEKNRFFKFHPHLLFQNYKYSIYIDGNIKINTDFTEHLNKLNGRYLGMYKHYRRDCIYNEIKHAIKVGKGDIDIIKKQKKILEKNGMPRNFGMLEACVIVREHSEKKCINLMENWWIEYQQFPSRDQISLSYVIWKQEENIDKFGILGNDIYSDYSFTKQDHRSL